MIYIMVISGLWALNYKPNEKIGSSKTQEKSEKLSPDDAGPEEFPILRNLAMSQLLLTLLTLTTAHVQIITRISSAYPVWLWYLATVSKEGSTPWPGHIVRFLVIYAVVQGGLFASFLPPA